VNHLRQIMLVELRRRNYAESTIRTTSGRWSISVATFIVRPISLAQNIFASNKQHCLPDGSWHRIP
jgi:hypothetical protein